MVFLVALSCLFFFCLIACCLMALVCSLWARAHFCSVVLFLLSLPFVLLLLLNEQAGKGGDMFAAKDEKKGQKRGRESVKPAEKGRKRLAADAKYGHGGEKKKFKKNDAKSTNDMKFSSKKNKKMFPGFTQEKKKEGREGKKEIIPGIKRKNKTKAQPNR